MLERPAYFKALDSALRSAGIYQPVMVVDLDRLDQNIDTLISHLPDNMALRIVAKSLPSPQLLAHICAKAATNRLMTFNLPMLVEIAREMPDATQLLGKPLPAPLFRKFLEQATLDEAKRVYWLIDTPDRLADYQHIAQGFGAPVNIVIELDVGLHRGGFEAGEDLHAVLKQLHQSNALGFEGFMGYEPHLASVPKMLGWRERATRRAWGKYQQAIATARGIFSDTHMQAIIRNTAGSPTFRLYKDTLIANEVSVGSALVKPAHFDTELLAPYAPACFIATPVLKAVRATRLPALEFADRIIRLVSPGAAESFFVHGGNWMADPVDPPGLRYNKFFGRSSNQEMLNAPRDTDLAADDLVFLRPHQSEAVFLQFGDLVIVRGGKVVDRWPSFSVSA